MPTLFKAIVALFTTAFLALAPEAPKDDVKDLQGKSLPPFSMTSTDGKQVTNASIKGHPVIIDFWASWCGPCKQASVALQELNTDFGPKGLVVIGANGLEDAPGPDIAREYAATHKYTYLFTHSNDTLMKEWKVNALPTIMFVDKDGKIVKVQIGYSEQLKAEMRKMATELTAKS